MRNLNMRIKCYSTYPSLFVALTSGLYHINKGTFLCRT